MKSHRFIEPIELIYTRPIDPIELYEFQLAQAHIDATPGMREKIDLEWQRGY